jgi:glyceraldehyde-3-phosphate dehydrogenase (ferredoxin)
VACKKYEREFKKDYEPYQALGPLCGVFDQRAAEKLNHFVDAMGWDAIQAGGTISWVMELIPEGMLAPADFGLPAADQMHFSFVYDPTNFDVAADSAKNAAYAQKIVEMILFSPAGEPFRQGIRFAAKELDQRYGLNEPGQRCIDKAVFLAHGEQGCMTPNQYWVPGMFAPMPMMGKYFTYYGVDFLPPRELGRRSVQRMVYELFSENSGVCRFHRKWVEAIVDEIIAIHYDLDVDYKAHQFKLAQEIYALDGEAVSFWESERTIDVIWQYLEKWVTHGLNDTELHEWVERFRGDKWAAARAYWDAYRAGIAEAFAAGPDAIPEIVAPYQAARADVMEK